MEKKSLKELIASRQDDAIIADVVLVEEIKDYDTQELTGYKIFARIPETNELPEIRLSFQKFNTETESYEVDKDKEKFTKDVIKEVFGGKIKDFTGEIQVWQFTTSKGDKMYSVYPLAIFTRADKFEDTNADLSKINAKGELLSQPYKGIIKDINFSEGRDLEIFIETSDIKVVENGKELDRPAIIRKKISCTTWDNKAKKYFPDPVKRAKVGHTFNKAFKGKLPFSEDFLIGKVDDLIGKEVEFLIKIAANNWYVDIHDVK